MPEIDPLGWLRSGALVQEEQLRALENIRRQAGRVHENQSLFHYTDHGISHSDRVVENLRRLSVDNLGAANAGLRLNQYELIVLIAAAYLHDLGMQGLVFIQDDGKPGGINPDISEQVRAKHAEFSTKFIEGSLGARRHEFPPLGLDQDTIVESLAEIIRDVVRGHTGSIPDLTVRKMIFDCPVRTGFLTALFRLADALDLNETRVKMDQLKRFKIPERSQLHWWRHHYVRSIGIEDGLISVHMGFPPNLSIVFVDYFKELVLDEIRRELASCNKVLFANGVRFILDEQVKSSHDEALSRRMPTTNLLAFIEQELRDRGEKFNKIQDRSKDIQPVAQSPRDWISYWKFKGNPWVDLPLQYRDEEFVETENIREMLAELDSIAKGKRGDLRILLGDRGSGKTTFFNVFSDFFEGGNLRAKYLDISEDIFEIHHPREIYDWLFRRIFAILTVDSTQEFSESALRREMRSYNRGKLILGIDNMDRFVSQEEQEIIRRFFAMAQSLLQDLKGKCVIVLSCAPSWRNMLQSADLHYLSTRGAWALKPFKKGDVKKLMEKRLAPSGLKFSEVFDDSVLGAIHSLSGGNPRRIVQIAEDLSKRAAALGAKRIDAKFVNDQLLQEVLPRMESEIMRIAKISDHYTEAVSRLFLFHERLERERLSLDVGWDIAAQLLERGQVSLAEIDENFLGALNHIAERFSEQIEERKFEISLIARPTVADFCKKWNETGFAVGDFVSTFKMKPWSPARIGAETAARIFEVKASGVAADYLAAAKEFFDLALGQKLPALRSIVACWEALRNLIKALYIHHGVATEEDFDGIRGEVNVASRLDREKSVAEMQLLLGKLRRLSETTGYIRYFDEIFLVANKTKKVLTVKPRFLGEFSDHDAELVRLSMKKVFLELLSLFQVSGTRLRS